MRGGGNQARVGLTAAEVEAEAGGCRDQPVGVGVRVRVRVASG